MSIRLLHKPLINCIQLTKLIFIPTCNKVFHNFVNCGSQRVFVNHLYTFSIDYSKNKDKGKDKKSKKGTKIEINVNELSSAIDLEGYKKDLQKHVDRMKEDFVKHVSLRSSSGAIESVKVSFEGKQYELQELAQVIRKNPKTTILNMATFPQAIPSVLSAIKSSGLNVNPQQDGTTLFIPVPKVTKEFRESLSKNAKMLFMKYKDLLRDVENLTLKKLRKKDDLSEDLAFDLRKQISAIGAEYGREARNLYDAKHKELMNE